VTGVVAMTVTLPGFMAGKAWKLLSYRFPVAIGAYMCAAICTRWVVLQIKRLWRKRPVKDLYLDGDDAAFVKYGGILQREAHYFLSFTSDAVSGRDATTMAVLRSALELPCEATRRDQYVSRLSEAVEMLENTTFSRGGRADSWVDSIGDVAPLSLPMMELGKTVLYVRLADACLRLVRDSLVGSVKRISSVYEYWDARYSPFYERYYRVPRLKIPHYLRLNGDDGDEEEGEMATEFGDEEPELKNIRARERRKDESRLVELELICNQNLERLGTVQAHLLRRPDFLRPTKEVLEWVIEGVKIANGGVALGPPIIHKNTPMPSPRKKRVSRLDGDVGLLAELKQYWKAAGDGIRWFRQQWENNETEDSSDIPFCPTPSIEVVEGEDGKDISKNGKSWKGTLEGLGRQVNSTSCAALNYREDLVHYVDERGIGKPKLGEVTKMIFRVAGYLTAIKVGTTIWKRRDDIEEYAGKLRSTYNR